MGLISDFLSASVSIDHDRPITPLDRRAYRELQAIVDKGDFVLPASLQAVDELQSIAVHSGTVSGGTFTLTCLLASGETFTTTALAHEAVAGTIETAVDVAATARDELQSIATHVPTVSGGTFTLAFVLASSESFTTAALAHEATAGTIETAIDVAATAAGVVGWANGDISVAGGHLNTNPVTLTFDGTSVKEQNHALVVMDDALLTGGGSGGAITVTTEGFVGVVGWSNGDITVAGGHLNTNPVTLTYDGTSVKEQNHAAVTMDDALLTGGGSGGAITTTTEGQSDRLGYAALTQLGIVSGTIPAEDVVPTALVVAAPPGARLLSAETIRAIALEIAIAEGNNTAIYDAIVAAAGV